MRAPQPTLLSAAPRSPAAARREVGAGAASPSDAPQGTGAQASATRRAPEEALRKPARGQKLRLFPAG